MLTNIRSRPAGCTTPAQDQAAPSVNLPAGGARLVDHCRARLAADDCTAMWTIGCELAHARSHGGWDSELSEFLVQTVEDIDLIGRPGGHALLEVLSDSKAQLSIEQRQRIVDAADRIVRTVVPGRDLRPLQYAAVKWIAGELGDRSLAVFKEWAVTSSKLGPAHPDLMMWAVAGFRCAGMGNLLAVNAPRIGAEEATRLYFNDRDGRRIGLVLKVPRRELAPWLNSILPLSPDDFLITSLLAPQRLPNEEPARDRHIRHVCEAVLDALDVFPPSQWEPILLALAKAILATCRPPEAMWSETRVDMFLLALSRPAVCADAGGVQFVAALGKGFAHLDEDRQQSVTELLSRSGDLFVNAPQGIRERFVDAIASRYPRAHAKAIFSVWKEAATHPQSPSRHPVLEQMADRGLAAQDSALAKLKELKTAMPQAQVPPTIATPMTVAPAVPADLQPWRERLARAIADADGLTLRLLPWQLLHSCCEWHPQVFEFFLECMGNRELQASAAGGAFVAALGHYLGNCRLDRNNVRGRVMRAADSLALHDGASELSRYETVRLLVQLDTEDRLFRRVGRWAIRPEGHAKDAVMMAYVCWCLPENLDSAKLKIDIWDAKIALHIETREASGLRRVIVPGDSGVGLTDRTEYFHSGPFQNSVLLTSLLDADLLPPATGPTRDQRIAEVVDATFRILPLLPGALRERTVRALPDAIMRTKPDSEPVWSRTRFDLFMRVLAEPRLSSEHGAHRFVATLQHHWPSLEDGQRETIVAALRARRQDDVRPKFAAAVDDLFAAIGLRAPVGIHVEG
jgi:hypothetical protein